MVAADVVEMGVACDANQRAFTQQPYMLTQTEMAKP